jgi:CheY-like chemotaxis protein
MDALGRLAGGIAHDFNNALMSIGCGIDLALEKTGNNPDIRRYLQRSQQATMAAAEITKQLLTICRSEKLELRVASFSAVLGETVSMLRRLIPENISLQFNAEAGEFPVLESSGQLHQLAMNLILNARDAIKSGGDITVELKKASGKNGQGEACVLTVKDTGEGVLPELLPKIFDPFFTTKERGKGTGLGLATVRTIVADLAGTIEVESHVAVGTTFRVTLPVMATSCAATTSSQGARLAPLRILLAEDEEDVRECLEEHLRQKGHRVISAKDGADAIVSTKTSCEPIEVLITDVVMPRMGGVELASKMVERDPELKVLFVSGHADGLFDGFRPGDNAMLLLKPFKLADLDAALAKVVEQHSVQLDAPCVPTIAATARRSP